MKVEDKIVVIGLGYVGLPLAVQVFDGVHFEADFKGARPWMSTELHGSANDSF